ncbi:MAG: ABC transporter permease, partial [Planctomycetes bacterium]|nr:ABC transporter permease [Planctomycetota bacterium]
MAIPLAYNLRNLVARRITTGMTMLGIGLVTFIFVTMFALGVGMERTLVATGHPLNVIILRVRASESQSEVSKDQVARLAVLPGIARDAEDKPLISAELVVVANARKKATGRKANIMVRGVGESARLLRDGLELISGRWPRPSLGEIAVGRGARERFADLDLDAEPVIRDRKWKVVGIFRAGGQAYESEIWTDVDDLRAQFKRDYSVVLARMRAPAETERFCRVVKDDRDLHLDARTHADYYREQNLGAG